jgi:trk system potassium uptake protein TrkA
MKVAVAGAGKVGTYIASHLAADGHDVRVLEQDASQVARLGAVHGDVSWHVGDACEVTFLQQARLDEVDVIVSATGDDEDNLVISLLAKQEFAVPRVVARVNHPKNHWLFNEAWGVDVAVSTPHLLTSLVEEAVSVGTMVRLLQLGSGDTRLVEVTLSAGSPAAGSSIVDLGVPRDATIVAVLREGNVLVPRGDTVLLGHDEVIALVTSTSEEHVRNLLVGPAS